MRPSQDLKRQEKNWRSSDQTDHLQFGGTGHLFDLAFAGLGGDLVAEFFKIYEFNRKTGASVFRSFSAVVGIYARVKIGGPACVKAAVTAFEHIYEMALRFVSVIGRHIYSITGFFGRKSNKKPGGCPPGSYLRLLYFRVHGLNTYSEMKLVISIIYLKRNRDLLFFVLVCIRNVDLFCACIDFDLGEVDVNICVIRSACSCIDSHRDSHLE